MAIDVFELQAKLGLDSQGFEKGLKDAKGGFGRLEDIAKKVSATAVKAVAGISTALTAMAGVAIKGASEYESAFAKVETIMDKSMVSTGELSSGILELSSRLGVASTEIADTVYNAISATGDTANAVLLTEKATKLAVAGFTDTTSALGVLTTAMNAYGLSADKAEHISDSLIKVQNLGVTTVGELSTAMGRAIATASAYGVDLENLESAYISLTKGGIATAESTTYLSSMLSELGKDGSTVSNVLKEQTGQGFAELMASGSSLADVLDILLASVDGNTSALMNLWGSQEAGKASNAIISQSVQQFNSNLETLRTTVGTTEDAFGIMAETFSHKASVLKETGRNLIAKLGEGLMSDGGSLIDLAISQMDLLSSAYETAGTLGMAQAGGAVIANFISTLVDGMPSLIDTAIAMIQSLVVGLNQNVDRITVGALQIMTTFVKGILDTLPVLKDLAYNIVASLINGLGDMLPTFIANLPDFIGSIVSNVLKDVGKLVVLGTELVTNLVKGIWDGVPGFVENLPNMIELWIESMKEDIRNLANTGNILIDNFIKMLKDALRIGDLNTASQIIQDVKDGVVVLNEKVQKAESSFTDMGETIQTVITQIPVIGMKASQTAQTVNNAFDKLMLKDLKISIDVADVDKAVSSIRISLENLGLSSEQIAELMSGSFDDIINRLENLGVAFDKVNDGVKESTFDALKYIKDRYEVTMADVIDTAFDLVDSLADSLADVGGMLVEGTASWENWGLMALNMIGETLIALGKQLAAMAVLKAITGDWVGAGLATAGSTAALIAGGALSRYAENTLSANTSGDAYDYASESVSETEPSTKEGGLTIIQNIQSVPLSAYELEQQAYAMADKLRWA